MNVKRETKYGVGKRLKIRNDLQEGKFYPSSDGSIKDGVTFAMSQLAGRKVTIEGITDDGKYLIYEDNHSYGWTDGMLEEIDSKEEEEEEEDELDDIIEEEDELDDIEEEEEDEVKIIVEKNQMETVPLGQRVSSNIVAEKVIFNNPATILFYRTTPEGRLYKSIAKCNPIDEFDRDKGLNVALLKAIIKEANRDLRKI